MKIDAVIPGAMDHAKGYPSQAGPASAALEQAGYSGVISVETNHDPFLPLALAAEHTSRVDLMTGIAVAFARNPMTLAGTAWDLQTLAEGRFILGLGSQIRPHITKRFSMPWSDPAARMQELIEAIRAIWDCWQTGQRLGFRGQYYRHTLMTPMFDPGPNSFGPPRIMLAAVGPLMTAVAGRLADGFISHAFQTVDYMRAVTLPNLEKGLAQAGRSRADFEVSLPIFVVSGFSEEEVQARAAAARKQIAFYGSTPAYRPVLEHHGWGDASDALNRLSKQGEWNEMANLIDDTMLDSFAIVAEPHELAARIAGRFGGVIDRLQFSVDHHDQRWLAILDEIAASAGT